MIFVPAVAPPSRKDEPAWWFIFRGNKLLVTLTDEAAAVPYVTHLDSLGLRPTRRQYLGTIDGHPYYSAELAAHVSAPQEMTFRELRGLFGLLKEDFFRLAGQAIQIMNWDRTHQYCGQCGILTEALTNERAKVCPKCGFISFPRISPAIIVAVTKGNQILLVRTHRHPSGLHSVIAGFVEPGETLEECVSREVKEEVGLEVRNICYFASQSWPFPNSLMVGFTADYAKGKISLDGTEIVDANWFTANDLPGIPDKISIARRLIDWFVETHSP